MLLTFAMLVSQLLQQRLALFLTALATVSDQNLCTKTQSSSNFAIHSRSGSRSPEGCGFQNLSEAK